MNESESKAMVKNTDYRTGGRVIEQKVKTNLSSLSE
jgi:hypothetical protein